MSHLIIAERAGGILHLSLNRPEKKNALTQEMYSLLAEQFEQAEHDPSVRVVALSGRGGNFTAGNDLFDFAMLLQAPEINFAELAVVRFLRSILAFSKPLLVGIQGVAIGIGTTLLLHCDSVIASADAKFALPFTKLGLVPEFGSSFLLPQVVGMTRARQLLLSGAPFNTQQALDWGIVTTICPPEQDLTQELLRQANQLSEQSANALRLTRQLLKQPWQTQLQTSFDQELQAFAQALQSADFQEAVQAFFEKRPPKFA